MSDKETAPWIKEAVSRIQLRNRVRGHVLRAVESGETDDVMPSDEMEEIIAEAFAAECTAPQTDWKKEALALVVLLRAKCTDEEWANMESRFAVECTAPAPTRPSVEFCICDDCERKRADNERFLKPGLGEHDHTPASAYPARYVAPKEKP